MESLLVLLALVALAIPLTIVLLLVSQVRLRRRVVRLEADILSLKQGTNTEPEPATEPEPKAQDIPTKAPPVWPIADQPETEQPIPPQSPQEALVFSSDRFALLQEWLQENWFYVVSALSLALAGIFLVQYGVENGLLPPSARVVAALLFGAALIVSGEVIRRRYGDGVDSASAYLPSVFSGAGLVTLFGGVLAARQLYGLIGPEFALVAMIGVASVGLVLGWFHGPLLAAVGLTGAFASPFLVGGSSDDPTWLYGYFLTITVLGLGIDTVRRWAWISVLTLVGGYSSCLLLVLSEPMTEPGYLTCITAFALITIAIPVRRIWPDHTGPMVSEMIRRQSGEAWPEFPTRLAFGAVAVSSAILALHWPDSAGEFWLSLTLLAGLAFAMIVWTSGARALQDISVFPIVGLVWLVFLQGWDRGKVAQRFAETYAETPEADFPFVVTLLVALGAALSVAAAWRSMQQGRYGVVWAAGAVITAPILAIALEIAWRPAEVLGAYFWGLHAMALGALMVVFAERYARVDGEQRIRPALATLSALSCLAFACVIVLSSGALTIALVVTVVAAAALDRRFNLPQLSWFIWAGVFTVTVRLILNPGLYWANTVPVGEMTLVYGAATLGYVLAWGLIRGLNRPVAILLLESAAWATAGILLSLLLLRWLEGFGQGGMEDSHWGLGLMAVIWLLLAAAQIRRFDLGGPLNYVRYGLAAFFAAHALFRLAQALTEANPVLYVHSDPVLGPALMNTLAIAYLLPAGVLAMSAWRIEQMSVWLRQGCFGLAGALAAYWLGASIRHFWQGPGGMYVGAGVSQPELYTYTLALLIAGAALFYQSLARRSDLLRKVGLAVIGLAVAKVFLIDIAGLGGLIRVFSLLALGLALAGLAWLNRWAKLRQSPQGAEPLDH